MKAQIRGEAAFAEELYEGAFDEMMASGAFASLPNEELKSRVASLYSSLDRFAAIVGYLRRDLSAAGQILWERIDFGYEEIDGRQSHTADYNLAEFCDDRLFRNAVWELADTHRDWINFAETILEQVDAVLIELKT